MSTKKEQKAQKPRRFRGALAKKFPRIVHAHGSQYVMTAEQKKYLNQPLNVLFLADNPHPIALDRYANVVALRRRDTQETFSRALKVLSAKSRTERTLAVSNG